MLYSEQSWGIEGLIKIFKILWHQKNKSLFFVSLTITLIFFGLIAYGLVLAWQHDVKAHPLQQTTYSDHEQFDIISKDRLNGNTVSIIKFKGTGCYYITTQSLDLALRDHVDTFVPYLNKEGKQVCE